MLDRVQEGYMTISDMRINSLMGNRERKGHIDVLLCIPELNDKLIFDDVPNLGLTPNMSVLFAGELQLSVCLPHESPTPQKDPTTKARGPVDLAWLHGWYVAEKKLVTFIEGIIFKNRL